MLLRHSTYHYAILTKTHIKLILVATECAFNYTVQWESWAGEKFSEFTLFEHLAKESLTN